MFSIVATVAFLAIALLAIFAPVARAAPASPHFGPSILAGQVPWFITPNPSLAVGSNGVVYVAFAGWGGATTGMDIFFTKSNDARTWSPVLRVNNDVGGATQADPAIALDAGNNISIAWADNRNGNNDIFFSKSTDGGATFSSNVLVNLVTGNAQTEPDLAIDPSNSDLIHIAWTDGRNGNSDIYYANSTDGGLSFNPSVRVNDDATALEQTQPSIAVGPNRDVYAVWTDSRNSATRGSDVYFSRSPDRGATWNANTRVNTDTGLFTQRDPTMAVDGAGAILVAWTDFRAASTAPDIYAGRSTNVGSSFANVKVNDDGGLATQVTPSLAATGGRIAVAWADQRTSGSTNWDIYASTSPDGLLWSANLKVNDESLASSQQLPSLAVDASGDVFVAWADTRGSGQDVYAGVLDTVVPVSSPGAGFTGDQGTALSFNGSASRDNLGIASYAWDFGDASSATGSTGSHTYANAGVYTAALTVWDYSGNSATSTMTVTVRDSKAPVALGGGDRSADETQSLFFDASASTDNVGVVSYTWDFGDGSSATTAAASHVYAHPGVYHATLTVKDAAGNSATSSFQVTVRPNSLLGWIEILAGIVAILTIAVILLGWMVWGRRKQEDKQTRVPPAERPLQPPPPPRDSDPLDMSFPPAPPKEP
jgi:PKD repeat protein